MGIDVKGGIMSERPNVLWIFTDEHRPDIAGFAGNEIVRTQNLDRLAGKSVTFTNASCTCPVCTSSRMSLLCGKDVHNCSAWNNHWVIFPEHLTWPAHFADHGYRTCLVGKMHYGGRDQMNGFQHRPYGDLRHGLGHQPDPMSNYPAYDNPQSGGITEIPESLLQDVVVTRETLAFLREHHDREPDTPWFACASFSRPHSPLTSPGRYFRHYQDKVPVPKVGAEYAGKLENYAKSMVFDITEEEIMRGIQGYYACVDFVDDCIGELLDGLEKDGLLDNTIIIYATDHGEMLGQFGCWGKTLYYRPSVNVPLLISGPGIPEGKTAKQTVSLIDLYPTICSMAGVPILDELDGVDFSKVLASPETAAPTREFAHSSYYRYGVRLRNMGIPDTTPESAWRCVHDEKWKYVEVEKGCELLFDMETDPMEMTNLAECPEHAERREKMREWLYRDFDWGTVHDRLAADFARLPQFYSGHAPGTPNQYMLEDGRIFDAEKSLYDARWMNITPGFTGGIIPQQFG